MDVSLITRCGIYCGACYIYRSFKDGGKFLDAISEQQGIPEEEIKCSGCLGPSEDLWRNCRKCAMALCLREKGYQFCYECSGFEGSCDKYERLYEFCLKRGEDNKESLNRVKSGEAEAWLKEQDAKWRCRVCGKSISWYKEKCHHCGQSMQVH